jgi:transposase
MMHPNASVEKVYLYPKLVDFRRSINGLAALVELDIKVAQFDPVLFMFLNPHRNPVKVLYWGRNASAFGLSACILSVSKRRPMSQSISSS